MTHDSSSIAALLVPAAAGQNASGKVSEVPLGDSLGLPDFSATWAALTAEDTAIVAPDAETIESAAEQQVATEQTEGEESSPQDGPEIVAEGSEAAPQTRESDIAEQTSKALSPPEIANRAGLPPPPGEVSDTTPKPKVSAPGAATISPSSHASAPPFVPLVPTAEAGLVAPAQEGLPASRPLEGQARTAETGLWRSVPPEYPTAEAARMPARTPLAPIMPTPLSAHKMALETEHKPRPAELPVALDAPEIAAPSRSASAPPLQFTPTMAAFQSASAMMPAPLEREAGRGERLSEVDLSKGFLDGNGIATQKRGGLNALGGASPPPATHVANAHVANQISAAITPIKPGTTEIALSPAELGSVRITVAAQEQGVQIMIATERPETAELLRRNLDLLSQDLRQSFTGEVSFSFTRSEGDGEDAKSHTAGSAARAMSEEEMHPQLAPSRHLLSANLDLRL